MRKAHVHLNLHTFCFNNKQTRQKYGKREGKEEGEKGRRDGERRINVGRTGRYMEGEGVFLRLFGVCIV